MSTFKDLRFAARGLMREPGIASVAVLTIALGVGANTAIFSVVNGVLLQPLPFPDPNRLVTIHEVVTSIAKSYPTLPVNAWHYTWWRQHAHSFESVAAADLGSTTLTGAGDPQQVDSARVSSNLFETLGVTAALGRTFRPREDEAGRDRVALVSYSLWQRRFSGDMRCVGRSVQLDSQPYTIIGILPRDFRFPSLRPGQLGSARIRHEPDVIRPLAFNQDELSERMGRFNYIAIGRLKRGTSPAQAAAELNVIAAQLETMTKEKIGLQAAVSPLRDALVRKSRRALLMLLAAVASVLFIACLNLASLFLARAERRSAECAVRIALGASRARLTRQMLTETVLLSVIGGIVGVALAAAGMNLLLHNAPPDLPRIDEVRLDRTVFLFALGLSVATGLLFGAGPVWRSTHVNPHEHLKSGGRTTLGGGASGTTMRHTLIAAEAGLSLVLLTAAVLLAASFGRVLRADQGFEAPSVLATDIQIPRERYRAKIDRDKFYERVRAKLTAQPGVVSAGVVTALPLTGETWIDNISIPGDNRPAFQRPNANVRFASADYFRTMGIPLVAGRTFSDSDRDRKVAIISERAAGTLWPGQNAVGRNLDRGGDPFEVIGVVKDVKAEADKPAPLMMYRPYRDWSPLRVRLVARSISDPRAMAGMMRAAVRSADADVPVQQFQTMQELLDDSVAQRRLQTLLISVFAGAALLLAAFGIYGVVAYSVARRRNEMGLRMALGATAGDVYSLVVRHNMRPVIAGLLLGVPAAMAAGRALRSLLYEVRPDNPAIVASMAALLATVALLACLIPARRATKVAPLETLRAE
ncbi:MAG: ABC transporter permease [Acidobacteria bacterium]|nr:ABC transporter permease [Acidobacteriota bacterium]